MFADQLRADQGKRRVPFFDAKADVEAYIKTRHPTMTAAFPFPGTFYTNFAEFKLARYVPSPLSQRQLVFPKTTGMSMACHRSLALRCSGVCLARVLK